MSSGDRPVDDHTVVDGTATIPLPDGRPPEPATLARIAAARTSAPMPVPATVPSLTLSSADALREEEIERTRLFIMVGWIISVVAIGTVPLVQAPAVTTALFIGGLAIGMVVSFWLYRRFADPAKYTERALFGLAMMCVLNGHIVVLFYGPFTAAPMMIVVGIHFVARTEIARVARWIVLWAAGCYAVLAIAIIAGLDDPGTFAPDRRFGTGELVLATVFVLAAYAFAYHVARIFRVASLRAIDELQQATRLASQREALMEELRADLERALQVGGPGRYSDHQVGSFRLGIVLGRGAMGEVYAAQHAVSGEPAAVKLLRREMLADSTQLARFIREVRASAAIASPYVVRVLETSGDDAALPYLAMERLHGHTLAEQLRQDPKLPPQDVITLCAHVGAAIDASRAAGIVHRDLKPANLMRTTDGTWKVLDFGVASLADEAGKLTQGQAVGTPHYMAPEQAQGRPVDYRADLYALATVVYRCLTGRYPFSAGDTPALLYAVVHRMPVRPSALAELPADVDRWCAIAMAKLPGQRFASGDELARTLSAALAGTLDATLRRRADALVRKQPWELA